MRCWCANFSSAETERVLQGKATASGKWLANHLSPACCSRSGWSKLTSPAGSRRLSLARALSFAGLIGSGLRFRRIGALRRVILRGQKFARRFRFVFGDLDQDSASGE